LFKDSEASLLGQLRSEYRGSDADAWSCPFQPGSAFKYPLAVTQE